MCSPVYSHRSICGVVYCAVLMYLDQVHYPDHSPNPNPNANCSEHPRLSCCSERPRLSCCSERPRLSCCNEHPRLSCCSERPRLSCCDIHLGPDNAPDPCICVLYSGFNVSNAGSVLRQDHNRNTWAGVSSCV